MTSSGCPCLENYLARVTEMSDGDLADLLYDLERAYLHVRIEEALRGASH